MSDMTVNAALRRMGFASDEISAHGFRSMARTLMAEQLTGINPEVVEAQLAHGKSGPLGAAYDRAEYLAQRRTMMQTWADYLDKLRQGADVIAFKAA
jgi:integrase